jgi:hypothetical protein
MIASLFSDDTTVYLTKNDSFAGLQDILNTWCKASGAKFNIAKTEIIPIGSKEYGEEVIQRGSHTDSKNKPRSTAHTRKYPYSKGWRACKNTRGLDG